MGRVLLALVSTLFLVTQVMAGAWTSNNFLYKPTIGARGDDERAKFESGLNRVDSRLANEKWLNDSLYNGDLDTAISSIGTAQTVLSLPAGTWPIAANLTVPANLTLKFAHGAVLTIATAKTLTINGTLDAGPYQIFTCTGTGKVAFAAGAVKEIRPEWWATNAVPGTTDMTAALAASLTACAGSGADLRLSGASYKITSGLTYDLSKHAFIGNGSKIYAAGVTGYALTMQADYVWADIQATPRFRFEGVELYGDRAVGEHGVYLGGVHPDTTKEGMGSSWKNIVIHAFDTALTTGDNVYILSFDTCHFYQNNLAFSAPTPLTNSGENITFNSCIFGTNSVHLNVNYVGVNLNSCSLDYHHGNAIVAVGAGVVLNSGHLEAGNDTPGSDEDADYWFKIASGQGFITLNDVQIYVAGSKNKELFSCTPNTSKITLNNCRIKKNSGKTYAPSGVGTGYVFWTGEAEYGSLYDVPVALWASNLLADGGFEDSGQKTWLRADWKVQGLGSVALDTAEKSAGARSLKIQPGTGTQSYLWKTVLLGPGASVYLSYKIKNTIGNATDNLVAKIEFFDASGYQSVAELSGPTSSLTYNQANANATFTKQTLMAAAPANTGACLAKISFYTNTSAVDGTSVHWLDEMILNVSQASPPPMQFLPARLTTCFTPTIAGGTNPGTGTYTSQFGTFWVVGNVCNFVINVTWSAHDGTGDLLIGGLPFTSLWNLQQPVTVYVSGVPFTGPVVQAYVKDNSRLIYLRQCTAAGANSAIPLAVSGTIYISGSYVLSGG
jgi:hypothetical protein